MTASSTGNDSGEGVRRARVLSRRRQLLDAAVTVMTRTGFHQMSMQALADEAEVSVGTIYQYFSSKEDVLLDAIVGILEAFADQLAPAMDTAGADPVERIAAGFDRYVRIIDANRGAVALTYRESRTLPPEGQARIMELEVTTAAPLREAVEAGIAAGVFTPVDVDLMVYDLVMLAHAWALKHWHFGRLYDLDTYIRKQLLFAFNTLIPVDGREPYRHHFHPETT
ncbi:TetR/AcrR family transcriptional regulator [Dietzia natronolimnaea]|uniref:TetR/AcrR family transcriptional regulator n=1 Tax=Dietzia natronolimnaea TaxID=161920 RepID=UPI0015F870F7|nr:TetR/AcrR family transcriptional regulator [Dietzia natronolimnaea]MBB1037998.1 TetR/AcrR family transcriptional regulator [Dietzia natronolimnaea]